MKKGDMGILCCANAGLFFCMQGISAASGSVSGAIGYSILTSMGGWEVANMTCSSVTNSMVIGSMIVTCPIDSVLGASGILTQCEMPDTKNINPYSCLASSIICGAFKGVLGAKTLGLAVNTQTVAYAAAAGATGGLVSCVASGIILINCGASVFICCDESGAIKLLKISDKNTIALHDGKINSLEKLMEGTTRVDPRVIGLHVNTMDELIQRVSNDLKIPMATSSTNRAPVQQDMERGLMEPLLKFRS